MQPGPACPMDGQIRHLVGSHVHSLRLLPSVGLGMHQPLWLSSAPRSAVNEDRRLEGPAWLHGAIRPGLPLEIPSPPATCRDQGVGARGACDLLALCLKPPESARRMNPHHLSEEYDISRRAA